MATQEPRHRTPEERRDEPRLNGLFGVGLDDDGGHRRITKGDEFYLVGGSAETHERMQGLVIRMTETLRKQGKKIQDLSRSDVERLARDSFE